MRDCRPSAISSVCSLHGCPDVRLAASGAARTSSGASFHTAARIVETGDASEAHHGQGSDASQNKIWMEDCVSFDISPHTILWALMDILKHNSQNRNIWERQLCGYVLCLRSCDVFLPIALKSGGDPYLHGHRAKPISSPILTGNREERDPFCGHS